MSINDDFIAANFEDFNKRFLSEKLLDKTHMPNLGGELSKTMSKASDDIAHKLNKWSSMITSKIERYCKKMQKRLDFDKEIDVRYIPASDGYSKEASIIILKIGRETYQISIFDNNRVLIQMPQRVANKINKGRIKKLLLNKDKTADFMIGLLERFY